MEKIRVGFGYDVHAFAVNRELWLGGIQVPYEKGLLGHSDADVVIHAICDALLGAANLRDIGYHFPDTSETFKNIDSKILLAQTMLLIRSENFRLGNIDITICAEKPKLNPYIPQMKICLSEVMNVEEEDISIKATTSEGMGFVGREEGIAVFATALIVKSTE
jgi:2-C-methyl-D-erythritol 2,4-cyclodiphosphate synthase